MYVKGALKIMPPALLCWPTMSQVSVADMTVEVEPTDIVTCCCRVTDGSRGALQQDGA